MTAPKRKNTLHPYLGEKEAWAISLGTAIGWGSLVVTANTYLAQAGPLGSTLGMLLGAAVMLVIARCYHYMMDCYPSLPAARMHLSRRPTAMTAASLSRGFLR